MGKLNDVVVAILYPILAGIGFGLILIGMVHLCRLICEC